MQQKHPKYELKKGHRIVVSNFRRYEFSDKPGFYYMSDVRLDARDELMPTGGFSYCEIVDKKGRTIADGSARCSRKDNFNKRLGKQIAVGRALKAASEL